MSIKYNIALATVLGLTMSAGAETGTELLKEIFSQTNHTPIVLLDVRTRYEYADQDHLDSSEAATMRARVGLQSQDYSGFSGLVEFEMTRAMNSHSYREGPYASGGKTVIADPENTELNRAQLQFNRNDNLLIFGRQRIILDNARFVGNVGWRQNEQTYDAVSYKNTIIEDVSLYYAYIDQVNRIFGDDAPGSFKKYQSDSHLINASYSGIEGQKLTTYAYLLKFDNADAVSANTYGASYSIKGKLDEYSLDGYAELAYQKDAGDNPTSYEALYYHVNGKIGREGYAATFGMESLGSDNGVGFSTPLATAHKFNGWNDQFLSTPAGGLRDYYVSVGLPVPQVPVTLVYHYFTAEANSTDYGQEFDAMAAHKFSPKTKAIAKYSYYKANDYGADSNRFSVEMNFIY